ncbi:MAG: hypothetical protein VB104_06945 [Candidatus Limiplasma sp.]|nr:hypothetical protein [Candidatus Limiplasma sp.]
MDYRSEVSAFNGQLERGTLSACEIALWHALHDVGIQCGHSDGLSIATVTLTARTGFSASAVKRARDSLRDKGFIRYHSRGSNRAAMYEIRSVAHTEPQRGPQGEPQDEPQRGPQDGPRGEPLYTTTTMNNTVVNISAHGGPQDEPQGEPQDEPQRGPQPWLSDDEALGLASGLNDVLNAAERAGFPKTQADYDRGNALVAQYGADAVFRAVGVAVNRPMEKRNWGYVEGILKKDPTGGTVAKQQATDPATGEQDAQRQMEARRREEAREEAILRREYR